MFRQFLCLNLFVSYILIHAISVFSRHCDLKHHTLYKVFGPPTPCLIFEGTLNFLARDERYRRDKPFALRYNPVEGIATGNILTETILDVPLHDIRDLTERPSFDENGAAVCELSSQMAYDDWFKDEKVKEVFFPELRKLLEDFFATPHIQMFEYRVSLIYL